MIRVISGIFLLVVGGAIGAVALDSPPQVYTYSTEQIDADTQLSEQVYLTASQVNSSVANSENLGEQAQNSIERATAGQRESTVDSNRLANSSYLVHQQEVYNVSQEGDQYAFSRVSGNEALEVLSVNSTTFSKRATLGVEQTLTPKEVVQSAISEGQVHGYTLVDTEHRLISHEGNFYVIESESRYFQTHWLLWSILLVIGGTTAVCGAGILVSTLAQFLTE